MRLKKEGKQARMNTCTFSKCCEYCIVCTYLYIDAKMGEHFAWPIITPDDRCCPQLSTLLSSVLSLLSEYPLPLFVPDSLPHYWSCTGCHRRINSQPRCGYKSITTAPFVVSTQSCNGISDNQELLQLSHTTLLLLNKYRYKIHLCSSVFSFAHHLFGFGGYFLNA